MVAFTAVTNRDLASASIHVYTNPACFHFYGCGQLLHIILGCSLSTANLPLLSTSAGLVERVSTFKLLGLNFDASLSWSVHITIITTKASKRLYFLKQLKRAGVPPQQLMHFYATVICPVLQYCTPVWHYAITQLQTEHLESIQKHAIHIIYPFTRGMSYSNILFVPELTSLESRHDQLSRSFFQDISHPSSSLYHLLPLPRDTSVLSRLRTATWFTHPISRTKKTLFVYSLRLKSLPGTTP